MLRMFACLALTICAYFGTGGKVHADWKGPYIGITAKLLHGHPSGLNDNDADLSFKTIVGSALIGYNLKAGDLMFGLETGIDKGGEGVHEDGFYNFEYSAAYYAGARVGYDLGRYLPYAKVSRLSMLYSFSVDHPMLSSIEDDGALHGVGCGVGLDIFFKRNGFARIELERRVFHAENLDFGSGFEVSFDGQAIDVLSAGIGYRF